MLSEYGGMFILHNGFSEPNKGLEQLRFRHQCKSGNMNVDKNQI